VVTAALPGLLLLAALSAPPSAGSETDDAETRRCLSCHSVTVAEHLHDWDRSVHARAGVVCLSCHVPAASTNAVAPPPGGADWPVAATTCGSCHPAVESAFHTSQHAVQASSGPPGPTCADCHTRAGGNVLPPERFAERCGKCHPETTAKGELRISHRAIETLDLLRRVTLARALLTQELGRHKRHDQRAFPTEESFRETSTAVDDLSVEWHRFDFDAVDERCRRLLTGLEELHRRLGETP
jgi:hypothetical protein